MEIGAEQVTVIIADRKAGGELRILGTGESDLRGMAKGEIVHIGDVVESVVDASGKAENSAGVQVQKLYYNLDDTRIESVWPVGSKMLDGEGEIQGSDVRAALLAAQRLAGNFEKKIVYACEVDYIVDEKDPVTDPVGIFGHQLDVITHLLLARAERVDVWARLMRRAGFSSAIPILSGLASAYGVLSAEERQGERIIWDLSKDYLNGLVLSNNRILEYRTLLSTASEWGYASDVILAVCQEFKKKHPGIVEVVLTGELAGDDRRLAELKNGLEIPVRSAACVGIARLENSQYASIVGLLRLAAESDKRSVFLKPERSTLTLASSKVRSFLSDYF